MEAHLWKDYLSLGMVGKELRLAMDEAAQGLHK